MKPISNKLEEKEQIVISLYNQGISDRVIAKKLNVSSTAIYSFRKRKGNVNMGF